MLSVLLSEFLVNLVNNQWLIKTVCIGYFSELILGTFGNFPVNKKHTQCYPFYRLEFG